MNLTKEQIKNEKKDKNKGKKRWFSFFVFDFIKWTGALPILFWFRLKRIYENKDAKKKIKSSALICANHIGWRDPIILHCAMWYRRLHIVATKELFNTKFSNWFFRHILCIPIDRENLKIDSYKEIINTLKDNRIVAIFPEGHINNNVGTVDYFKSGIVLMAKQSNVPIVPMLIVKKEKWYQRQKVVIGQPIYLPEERMNLNDIGKFSELLREKEVELLNIYNKRRKK